MSPEASRILLVEDERNLGSTLVERFTQEGFQVEWAPTAAEAERKIAAAGGKGFDLALMDVGLPDGNGFELAGKLRARHPATAILFLTAFGSPEDRVRGLELGAEDYVVKPFHLRELLLRVQNALKRAKALSAPAAGAAGEPVRVGRAEVRFASFEAVVDGRTQALTHKEAAVLRLLVDRRGAVVSRDEILDQAWSADEFPTPRTVDNFIMRLRRLVEDDPDSPKVIRSVRGVGYQLS